VAVMSAAMRLQCPTDYRHNFDGVSETPLIESGSLPVYLALRYPIKHWNTIIIIVIIFEDSSGFFAIGSNPMSDKTLHGVGAPIQDKYLWIASSRLPSSRGFGVQLLQSASRFPHNDLLYAC
jgi:hypothetical protein